MKVAGSNKDQITVLFIFDPPISADQLVELKDRKIFFGQRKTPTLVWDKCMIIIFVNKTLTGREKTSLYPQFVPICPPYFFASNRSPVSPTDRIR